MKTASFAVAAAFVALAACATPTPYQPKDQSGYGFSDQRLEANRYRIEFKGNSLTSRAQVDDALLYRAADVTLSNGYDYFIAVQRGTDAKSSLVSEGPAYPYPYFGGRYYAHGLWRPWYDPFWDEPANYYQVTRYEASGEILMYKGKKPANDPAAFDAREVKANLQSKVVPPPPKS